MYKRQGLNQIPHCVTDRQALFVGDILATGYWAADISEIQAGDTVCTLVNGLGATPLLELYVMNRKLARLLQEKGIQVHDMDVGTYVTSLEMAGASVTILKLDDELKNYYDMPCRSPYYKKG